MSRSFLVISRKDIFICGFIRLSYIKDLCVGRTLRPILLNLYPYTLYREILWLYGVHWIWTKFLKVVVVFGRHFIITPPPPSTHVYLQTHFVLTSFTQRFTFWNYHYLKIVLIHVAFCKCMINDTPSYIVFI